MDNLIRIGDRLFNLAHVASVEPAEDKGQVVVDVHIVPGRTVRLRGDDALAMASYVSRFEPEPVDAAARDAAELPRVAVQDAGAAHVRAMLDAVDDTRG